MPAKQLCPEQGGPAMSPEEKGNLVAKQCIVDPRHPGELSTNKDSKSPSSKGCRLHHKPREHRSDRPDLGRTGGPWPGRLWVGALWGGAAKPRTRSP